MIIDHLDVADAVANRYRGTSVDSAELRQVAYLGLTKAVKRFDPTRPESLVAFAVPTIDGEIKHYLRDASWAVRPPRALQELSLELNAQIPELTQRLGRPPSVEELEEATGRPRERIVEALAGGLGRRAVSLTTPIAGGGSRRLTLADTLQSEDDAIERFETELLVAQVLDSLPCLDRRLVRLRFFLEMTQTEIAEILGMSQMQVSRSLASVLEVLRVQLSRALAAT